MNERDKPEASDINYARQRESNRALRYRLARRTLEIGKAVETHCVPPVNRLLDLGCADGRMLCSLGERLGARFLTGVEFGKDLSMEAKSSRPELEIVRGDIQSICFLTESFDAVTAAAVIEHVPRPQDVFHEAFRVLRPGGILAMTAPDPFWEHVASMVGHLKEEGHHHVMKLDDLRRLAREAGFEVVLTEKFMLSPIGMPFEFLAERIVRALRLDFLMANQLLIARKP
jgi:trans-aconitate methyltransferase